MKLGGAVELEENVPSSCSGINNAEPPEYCQNRNGVNSAYRRRTRVDPF